MIACVHRRCRAGTSPSAWPRRRRPSSTKSSSVPLPTGAVPPSTTRQRRVRCRGLRSVECLCSCMFQVPPAPRRAIAAARGQTRQLHLRDRDAVHVNTTGDKELASRGAGLRWPCHPSAVLDFFPDILYSLSFPSFASIAKIVPPSLLFTAPYVTG